MILDLKYTPIESKGDKYPLQMSLLFHRHVAWGMMWLSQGCTTHITWNLVKGTFEMHNCDIDPSAEFLQKFLCPDCIVLEWGSKKSVWLTTNHKRRKSQCKLYWSRWKVLTWRKHHNKFSYIGTSLYRLIIYVDTC